MRLPMLSVSITRYSSSMHVSNYKASRNKIKYENQTSILADQVYEQMLKDIIGGRTGAKLSEEAMCDKYGVSRTPVREAMLKLERDGLVERIPRRGFF